MPHILILGTWKEIAEEQDNLSHQILENIENEMYSGKQLEDAQALTANVESFWEGVNTSHRSTADSLTGQMESFLA